MNATKQSYYEKERCKLYQGSNKNVQLISLVFFFFIMIRKNERKNVDLTQPQLVVHFFFQLIAILLFPFLFFVGNKTCTFVHKQKYMFH